MNFASVKRNLSQEVSNDFEKVKIVIDFLKTFNIERNGYEGNLTATSHIICEAIEDSIGLEAKSGIFAKEHEHYWLVTNHGGFIIDVLPNGIYGGPILVDPILNHLYKEKELHNFSPMQYNVHIRTIATAIREFLKNHP